MREDRADGHHPGALGHCSRARSRSLTFWIFPVLVMGNSSTKATWRGIFKLAPPPRLCRIHLRPGDGTPSLEPHEAPPPLGERAMGHADPGGGLDGGVAHEIGLALHRIDVPPADLQHVLVSSDEAQVA